MAEAAHQGRAAGAEPGPVDDGPARAADSFDGTAALRHQIEETREEIGDTAAALLERTDVKRQIRARLAGAAVKKDELVIAAKRVGRRTAGAESGQSRAPRVILLAVGVAAIVLVALRRRRRR